MRIRVAIMAGLLATLFGPLFARAEMLKPGDQAPDFTTEAVLGDQTMPVHLLDFRSRKVVLYFYPKDSTPGCTREACAFRDGYQKLQNWGIVVLGCSVDSADSHRAFAKKYRLPFPLLLDPDKKIAKSYGADNGIPILGLDRRVTYVIGEDGRVLKVYPRVDPGTHATEIISDLKADQPPPPAAVSPSPSPTPSQAAEGYQRKPLPTRDSDSE